MRKETIYSINHPSRYLSSWLLAAAILLFPAAAAEALGPDDTATGTGALAHENGGHDNTADGYNALTSNTTGYVNTASGSKALLSNTTGFANTASGGSALFSNTTGYENTATGNNALYANATGQRNTASGFNSLGFNTTGNFNTASGSYALSSTTTGNNNVAFGYSALYANTTASNNVAVGAGALSALAGRSNNNIALGMNAGELTTSGSSNIYIGHPGISGAESKITRIGDGQSKVFVAGVAGVPLSGATVVVKSNGQLGVVASSARYKQDIHSVDDASGKLAQLRPVSFRYTAEPETRHYGLIAEEVDKVMPELVVRDDQKRPDSVQYLEIIPLLLQQWKAQQAEIARQRTLIDRQEADLVRQQNLIERQQGRVERQETELAELRRALANRLATLGRENTE